MGRRLILVTLTVTLMAAIGCGGGTPDAIRNAPAAKPVNIGNPGSFGMGVTPYLTTHFIVKEQFDGETRMYALASGVPGGKAKALAYHPDAKMFVEEGSFRRYDINGKALHKIAKGPKKGEIAAPMDRFKVTLDPKTGSLLLEEYTVLDMEFRDNKDQGAYVVVP